MNPLKQNETGDWVCEHGTAWDVHCCNCQTTVPPETGDTWGPPLRKPVKTTM